MKSPSPAQGTAIYPTTLSNSIHQHVSNSTGSQAFPTTTTYMNTSYESDAGKRQSLRMILDSAIALIDNDFDDDFNPIELYSPLHRRPQ
jgi:hypothetical protein